MVRLGSAGLVIFYPAERKVQSMGSAWQGGRTVFGKMAGAASRVFSDVDEQFEC